MTLSARKVLRQFVLVSTAAAVFLCQPFGFAQSNTLSDAEVSTILLSLGTGDAAGLFLPESVNLDQCDGFSITLWSPQSWVRDLGRKARRDGSPLSVADVTQATRERVWRLKALASSPFKEEDINAACADSVGNAQVIDVTKVRVVDPIRRTVIPSHNAAGQLTRQTGLTLTFDDAAVRDVWGPAQDRPFAIRVIGKKGESHEFAIQSKHFQDLK